MKVTIINSKDLSGMVINPPHNGLERYVKTIPLSAKFWTLAKGGKQPFVYDGGAFREATSTEIGQSLSGWLRYSVYWATSDEKEALEKKLQMKESMQKGISDINDETEKFK